MNQVIAQQLSRLPRTPGVYLFRDEAGNVMYVGKATILKTRVSSYFQAKNKEIERPIEDAISKIHRVDSIVCDTTIEALLLEAELIKKYWPPYNVLGKDGRSFLYIGMTRDDFPKVMLIRGNELSENETERKKKFCALFGPYTSATSIRLVLKIVRKIFPFSTCVPPQKDADTKKIRACFYRGIGLCPGVCTGEIQKRAYRKTIRHLINFFRGKKKDVLSDLKKEMHIASSETDFELATLKRNQIFALLHIQDIALIRAARNESAHQDLAIHIFGRIEGYDISHMSGSNVVGSCVVFVDGVPEKQEYRKFSLSDIEKNDDVLMMETVIRRRFRHDEWESPELLLIDGGLPQVNRVCKVLKELGKKIPVVGIAKGKDRAKNEFIFSSQQITIRDDLEQIVRLYPHVLIAVRDEAHRFAQAYYRLKHRRANFGSRL